MLLLFYVEAAALEASESTGKGVALGPSDVQSITAVQSKRQ